LLLYPISIGYTDSLVVRIKMFASELERIGSSYQIYESVVEAV